MNIVLRPDQQDLKLRIYNDWNNGAKNVLVVLSTGGGKSVIMSDMVLDGARENKRQIVIAHRNELVSQMSAHVANRGIPHQIIGSKETVTQITRQHRQLYGRSFVNPTAETAVAGVDTIIARHESLKSWLGQVDRWYGDEWHHCLKSNKWGTAVSFMPLAQGMGATATPLRADGMGLGREYDGVIDTMQIGLDMRSLINIGALSDYEIACPPSDLHIDESEIGKSGDWSPKKLRTASKNSKIIGCVVENYHKYAHGKQGIVFATDVETAGDIARRFHESGIRAASLSAKTNTAVREKYIAEFRAGTLKILVNVDLFDEGFDVPACEVVIMARPTASLGKYRQMAGRCLRAVSGKLYGLIIDHVGNVKRHGFPDKFIDWTLARRDKRGQQEKDPDDIELTVCLGCTKPYEKFYAVCPYCGFAPPLPDPQQRTIEMVAGDLILLDRDTLARMRAAITLENPADIAGRVAAVAGDFAARGAMNRQLEKIEAHQKLQHNIAQWAAVEREKGFDDQQIYRKFYLTTGVDILSALDGSRSRSEFDDMAARVERWYS